MLMYRLIVLVRILKIESAEPVSPNTTQLTPTFSQYVIFTVGTTIAMSPAEPYVFADEANPAFGLRHYLFMVHHIILAGVYATQSVPSCLNTPNFDADVSCQYVPDVIAPAGSDVVASNCAKSMAALNT